MFRKFIPCLALFLAVSCAPKQSKLPKYDHVPAFSMTDAYGNGFDSSLLSGKAWVADFIYTTCPAECSLMSAKMRVLDKRLPAGDDVRLVSFSVDPDRDTPPVLQQFAKRYGAPNDRWIFLTGTPASVHQIAYTTFHVGDVIGKMQHSTKFVLVDKQGFIRGYYSSFDDESMNTLLSELETLRKNGV